MLDRIWAAVGRIRTRRGQLSALALAVFVAGVTLIGVAVAAQQHAPKPSAGAYGTLPGPGEESPSAPAESVSPPPGRRVSQPSASTEVSSQLSMPASRPTGIDIPAIGVRSSVFPIGKDSTGGLAVPQPGPNLNKVAWFENSPTPGQVGPAVLEGHIDTDQGRSVFFRLGALKPGEQVSVTRDDHTIAVFTIDAVRAYPSHDDFPTDLVYGGDLTQPTLRLITCSNFDRSIGHYVGNTIVFAHLTATRKAPS